MTRRLPLLDRLEARQLFCSLHELQAFDAAKAIASAFTPQARTVNVEQGPIALAAARALPSVSVNFQPASTATPSGYVADTGATYGDRNGLSYGWNLDLTSQARDRNAVSDQRYDTFIHTQQGGSGTWEIALPNGSYRVHLVAGDPSYFGNRIVYALEGATALDNTVTSGQRLVESTTTVTVTDGKLTLTNANGSSNNKIAFLDIVPNDDTTPTLFSSKIDFQPSGVATATGYLADTGATYSGRNGQTYGWSRDISSSGRDRNLLSDQKYDTLLHTQLGGSATWEMAVPNGRYSVKLAAGDAAFFDSVFRFNVEGSSIINATPSSSNRFSEATITVTVSDGKLTLTNGSGASNNKVDFIEITQLDSTTPPPPTQTESWTTLTKMPVELSEIASGVVGDKLFVIGSYRGTNNLKTLAYDLTQKRWLPIDTYASRPVFGDHHAIEVYNNKMYVIGGLLGAGGRVQIFDPASNSWTLGASMPWDGGAVATSLINGKIYAAGGVVGSLPWNYQGTGSVNTAAVYDIASNRWTPIANMPFGRHHTATATDGSKMYVFGGREGVNTLADGFNDIQVYDPATGSWSTSRTNGMAPLPVARSGMGKAVYTNGNFYIMGGESLTEPNAINQVYNRVDVYNLTANAWRRANNMPTARHGTFPTLYNNAIYLAGGGDVVGVDSTDIFEVLQLGNV